jgi:hypothetical protein
MKLLFAALFLFAAVTDNAHAARAERRERHQGARIQQGVNSGELTDAEAARLRAGQSKVDRAGDRMAADGTVTGREKRRLEHLQDRQSRKIWRKKHNARDEQP